MAIEKPLQFNLDNYPKSFGSIDGWRLGEFLHLPEAEQAQIYKHLEHFCLHRVGQCSALSEHLDYPLLGSGWEWSVFAKDEQVVLKVPAGIFPEVNAPVYITNAQRTYELLSKYFPSAMLADTTFARHGDTNVVEQARLSGRDNMVIDFEQADVWLLRKLVTFFESTAALLEHTKWIPDFWLNHDPRGFILRNVMIDERKDQFAIIDFTSYLDPARMYPALCHQHCQLHTNKVQEMLSQTQAALARLNQA